MVQQAKIKKKEETSNSGKLTFDSQTGGVKGQCTLTSELHLLTKRHESNELNDQVNHVHAYDLTPNTEGSVNTSVHAAL